jgi:hypothetical protein
MTKTGKSNAPAREVIVLPARCPHCNSTELQATPGGHVYRTLVVRALSGVHAVAGPYNQVTWRRCKCTCGQVRVERLYELVPTAAPKKTMAKSPDNR